MRSKLLATLVLASAGFAEPAVIAHWPLDSVADGQAADLGPNSLHAALTGGPVPQVVDGQRGQALRLADGDAALVVKHQPVLDLQPPFTIALWMRPEKAGVAMELVCRAQDSGTEGWRLRGGWGQVNFRVQTADGLISVGVPSRTVPEHHWVHVAVTADGQKLRLYLNAEPVAETDCTVAPPPTRLDLVLGNYVGRKNAYPFVGVLDDIWILGECLDREGIYRLASGQ